MVEFENYVYRTALVRGELNFIGLIIYTAGTRRKITRPLIYSWEFIRDYQNRDLKRPRRGSVEKHLKASFEPINLFVHGN